MGIDAIAWPSIGLASTSSLMAHFDEDVYDVSQTGHLYKFVSALTGGSGAGDLVGAEKGKSAASAKRDLPAGRCGRTSVCGRRV